MCNLAKTVLFIFIFIFRGVRHQLESNTKHLEFFNEIWNLGLKSGIFRILTISFKSNYSVQFELKHCDSIT